MEDKKQGVFRKRSFFESVNVRVNFSKMEEDILKRWDEKNILKRYLQKNIKSKKIFSFLDGPITANNPMGVHHAWGRTYKDLWQRFFNMKGFRQRFQNGFDCQGLWVEVEVEKELGFKSKKDIEDYGIEKFVECCKERVKRYSNIQTEQSKRLGYFADWDNSYYTLSEDNNYMIWHFLKVCHENGWIYKGDGSVPWCPRCETAISQHEMLTEDYKEATHESIYMLFPIEGRKDEYLLVWTTTPWTIPANVAIAVDEKFDYILVEVEDGKKFWLAQGTKDRVFNRVKYRVLDKVKGSKLLGLSYRSAFDYMPAVKKFISHPYFHKVIPTDDLIMPISEDEGTGLVHTAVSAGTEDFKLGKKLNLPLIPVINDDASYLEGFDFLSGKNAKDNPRLVLDYMESKGFSYKIEKYTHRYPACWRCKTELVWKVTEEWYLAMDKVSIKEGEKDKRTLRQRMIDNAKKIKWIPEFGLEREIDWLTNMGDWLISKKNRYWGLALPIWECKKCGYFDVIGSYEELRDKVVEGWNEFEGKTPHKPQMDRLLIKCRKCGDLVKRIEPVGNPWLDAGIVAFSTVSENNKASNFNKTNTKPLYLENKEKWRKWIPADFITESFPGQFKNWFYSLIAMSTVLEDIPPFKTVLGFATLFAEDGRPMHKSWGNMIEFGEGAEKIGVDVMRWMYARQNPEDNLLFGYRVGDEVRRRFHLKLWNIYNFFVTYANLVFWKPKKYISVPKSRNVLDIWIVSKLKIMIDNVEFNLERYDAYSASRIIEEFVEDLSNWYLRRSRERAGHLSDSFQDRDLFFQTMYFILVNLSKILAPFLPFLSEIIYTNLTKEDSVHLTEWPVIDYKPDSELIETMRKVRLVVEKAHSERKLKGIPIRQVLSKLEVTNLYIDNEDIVKLIKDELNVKEIVFIKGKGEVNVKFDTKITPDLEEEAKTRDLIRKIQQKRKEMGISLNEQIYLKNLWFPKNNNLIEKIKKTCIVSKYSIGDFEIEKL